MVLEYVKPKSSFEPSNKASMKKKQVHM
ncbi:uncharacterized protein G2W53_027835 [Senna tora]|uniref:Uncharacterized protein n=1 Tax=Senna tora TaxID=362788 RepID=A0A834WGE0_9FABA|nr:uncharacterized protein G2W53_027835 [Senna tora]